MNNSRLRGALASRYDAAMTLLFLNQKGGCGKTTLAVHTSVVALESGLDVLLADTDPQASAVAWSNARSFESDFPRVVKASAQSVERLRAERKHTQLLIVDSAPHTGPDAYRLARAADLILIPCRPTSFDLSAVASTVDIVRASQTRAIVILSACPPRAPEIDKARLMLSDFGFPLFPGQITERRSYARAVADGKAVTEFDAHGKGAEEIRALWSFIQEESHK
jgi:chromosome partitioning protein